MEKGCDNEMMTQKQITAVFAALANFNASMKPCVVCGEIGWWACNKGLTYLPIQDNPNVRGGQSLPSIALIC